MLIRWKRCGMVLFGLLMVCCSYARADLQGWRHSGSLFILTTPEGADLPATALEHDFPLLVRLNRDSFDFRQAKPHGEDIRFTTPDGVPLPHQIEAWDATAGVAAIWVRIPIIQGNARQEIRLHWGNPDAASESSGPAVFNSTNGYLSVLHMGETVRDEVGTVQAVDHGTAAVPGIVGTARRFAGGQGIACGEQIPDYPMGDAPHSSEAWFRATRPNVTVLGWGNEGGGRGSKVRMQFRSPPHLHIDSDFSDVNGKGALPMGEWIHVVHTYTGREGRIYINGRLDGADRPRLDIKRPARMWIGGWYDNYDFNGDIDEVRISSVARSADWVRLEYENQRPQQTLVGPIVQGGNAFNVSPTQITLREGHRATFVATAARAQQVYWAIKRDGRETVAATSRFHFTLDAGRVAADQSFTLLFKAVYPDRVKTLAIPVTIRKDLPEPIFTLAAPPQWDGRRPLALRPQIVNLAQLRARGVGNLRYAWSVAGLAAIAEPAGETLRLKGAQNSGKLTVTLSIDNGGVRTAHTVAIRVQEPQRDPWIPPTFAADEKPEDNRFYARNDRNEGVLAYNGNLARERYAAAEAAAADTVFLKVYADDKLVQTVRRKLAADRGYALSATLRPGLIRYRVEFGVGRGEIETILRTVDNLVCGDAYLIDGQSNAEATAWGEGDFPYASDWIRSYGSTEGGPEGARLRLWGNAAGRARGGRLQIGYWGLVLARRLVADEKVPICILNGAVGGTRIDQHQRNPQNPEDVSTIYGRLLWRVRQAGLTHGIRGILWHQGENDQGADGPTGGYGWETYRQYYVAMSAAWKQDYPNVRRYYLFQIWPKSCSMGIDGSDNRLREVQRQLPALYARMSIMSTLGIKPPGSCHFPPAGYAEMARLICGLVERDSYGRVLPHSVAPPDLKQVRYTSERRDEIALVFDQPMAWTDALASQFYLDGVAGRVIAGSAAGNVVTLKLNAPATARQITYLDSKAWSENNLLYGRNGIAALTFCEAPILPAQTHGTYRAHRSALSVLGYLQRISGKRTVAGIHNREPNGKPAMQTERMFQLVGRYPGLWSGDFLFSADDVKNRWTMIRECRRQWEQGSIVQLMLHVAPPNQPEVCQWEGGIKSHLSDEQWKDLVTDGGTLNRAWKARLDGFAVYLQYLKDNGVQVLFRPHHEMNQGAFWWGGRKGPDGTAKLYRVTHDYLVRVKGLTNLIWVWDMQDMSRDFKEYDPGDRYWDLFAFDVYGDGYNPGWYDYILPIVGKKPMAIGECDHLPTPQILAAQPRWCFFMSWAELTFTTNSSQQILDLYRSPQVVTRDRLPKFR